MITDKRKYIIIGADLVPTSSNLKIFQTGKIEDLLGEKLYEQIKNAECRIFNLEMPITYRGNAIKKCGPNMRINPKALPGIKKLNPTFFSLANNHIFDYGEEGFCSTLTFLEKYKIKYVGAGYSIEDACKPRFFEYKEKKIGFYACAEHEFSVINDYHKMGANPYDPLESYDQIRNAKEQCDFLVILFHGGAELYRYPTPEQKKICRKMVEKGANLVLCQHNHCVGSFEKYKDSHILYGQGNFLSDYKKIEEFETGLLVKLYIDNFEVEYLPIRKDCNKVKMAENREAKDILKDFYKRSEIIKENEAVNKLYCKFAINQAKSYLYQFSKFRLLFLFLEKICRYSVFKYIYSEKKLLYYLSIFRCETHRERVIKGLEEILYGGEIK